MNHPKNSNKLKMARMSTALLSASILFALMSTTQAAPRLPSNAAQLDQVSNDANQAANNYGSRRNTAYWYRHDARILPTPQAGRMTDEAIHQDYLAYEAQQARINASAGAKNPYASAKAQCWLDVSFQEYTRNDRSSFVEESFIESKKITDDLSAGSISKPWEQTLLVNQATNTPAPIAQLWQRLGAMSASQKSCNPAAAACAEVELVHAGNEWNQGGFAHANPYILLADRYTKQAEQPCFVAPAPIVYAPIAVAPTPPVVVVPALAPAVVPAPVVVPPPIVKPAPVAIVIPQRVHFPFDQDYIAPGTNDVLNTIARALKANPGIKLSAVGHTDLRASVGYNIDLSMRRVSSVMQYLKAAGVQPGQIQLGSLAQTSKPGAAGKSQLDKTGNTEPDHQYNRRVEFALLEAVPPATLVPQYADLHPCNTPVSSKDQYWCDNQKYRSGTPVPKAVQKLRQDEKTSAKAQLLNLQKQ